jgi:hypothetical protein
MKERAFNLIMAAIVLGLVAAFVVPMLNHYFDVNNRELVAQRPFSAEQWRTASSSDRGAMIVDLLGLKDVRLYTELFKFHFTPDSVLYGMSRDEILELLGPPDSAWEMSGTYLAYKLGMLGYRGDIISEFALRIQFDLDGNIRLICIS